MGTNGNESWSEFLTGDDRQDAVIVRQLLGGDASHGKRARLKREMQLDPKRFLQILSTPLPLGTGGTHSEWSDYGE